MTVVADAWYDAGSTGLIATVILGVLGIAVAVWAAFRAAKPRQELAYEVRAIVPLLNPSAADVPYVDIYYDGEEVNHPHVVELHLHNRGSRDIATAQFDQDRAFVVDVGGLIKTVLNTVTVPSHYKAARLEADGSSLRVGPDLIKKGQLMKIALLVDGTNPRVTCPEPPFIDVDVRNRAEMPTPRRWLDSPLGTVGVSLTVFVVYYLLSLDHGHLVGDVVSAAWGYFGASLVLGMTFGPSFRSMWHERQARRR